MIRRRIRWVSHSGDGAPAVQVRSRRTGWRDPGVEPVDRERLLPEYAAIRPVPAAPDRGGREASDVSLILRCVVGVSRAVCCRLSSASERGDIRAG
ncbi:hypothetical protein DL765_005468 [Monosporascus sp. GIB2]|nr:hypothetical protein DL765_005468 [Monosporascus sp. GIB2]